MNDFMVFSWMIRKADRSRRLPQSPFWQCVVRLTKDAGAIAFNPMPFDHRFHAVRSCSSAMAGTCICRSKCRKIFFEIASARYSAGNPIFL